jgi:hypothetical protein
MKPPDEKGALLHAPIPKLLSAQQYHLHGSAQACLRSWEREAARLFSEYWRIANQKHLAAFCTHVVGMRAHGGRST